MIVGQQDIQPFSRFSADIVGQSWSSDMPRSGVMPRFCAGYLTAMRARILVPVVWAVKAPPVMATLIAYTMEVPIIVRVVWVGSELAIAFAHDSEDRKSTRLNSSH